MPYVLINLEPSNDNIHFNLDNSLIVTLGISQNICSDRIHSDTFSKAALANKTFFCHSTARAQAE